MKLFQCILLFGIYNANFVTGEEMFLLTENGKLYWYSTENKETKQIAEKAVYMACDYQRKWLYYTSKKMGSLTMIVRARMDKNGSDMRIITGKDEGDSKTSCVGVDQETGNVYYASTKGLVLLSYKQNYTKTVISTRLTGADVFDVGFHGKGPNKRVYWSASERLYTSQINNPQLTRFKLNCFYFSVLDTGIVCGDIIRKQIFLADLNGMRTESLPNISIQSSKLRKIDCNPEDITTLDGRMYFVCLRPNRVFQMNLKTTALKVLVSVAKEGEQWDSVCPLPDQKVVLSNQEAELPGQSLKILSVSTILTTVIVVVFGIVLIAIVTVAILRYKKKNDSMPRRSNNHPIGEPEESQPPSTGVPRKSKKDQTKESIYFSKPDNKPEECHLYDSIPFTEHKLSTPEYVEIL